MKTIIAGGRDYNLSENQYSQLELLPITEVISGGAMGVDNCAEEWARSKRLNLTIYEADWKKHGRAAGPIRNEEMAKYAEACVLFPGGKGTADMAARAKKHNLKIYDYR
jgi:YspA, cpYpsA-related SLOG family